MKMVGYTKLDLSKFPSQGKFYREDFEISLLEQLRLQK